MAAKEKEKLESEIDYAYGVIDAVVEAMDRVAVKPEYAELFVVDMLRKMPEMVDALMVMTKVEHRPKMAELVKASSRMACAWLKKIAV